MMTSATSDIHEEMFGALCRELGFCLHEKGRRRVIEALDSGLDAAVKAVFAAEGVDFPSTSGDLRRQVRDCLKSHLASGAPDIAITP
jgi:hypothetical protein